MDIFSKRFFGKILASLKKMLSNSNTYSILALVLSLYVLNRSNSNFREQMEVQIKHDKFSVRPLIDMRLNSVNNTSELYMINVGEGPATILSVEFFFQGRYFPGVKEFVVYLKDKNHWMNARETDSIRYGVSLLTNDHLHLAKGEKFPILLTEHAPFEAQLQISRVFDKTGTRITYIDLYNDTLERVFKSHFIEPVNNLSRP